MSKQTTETQSDINTIAPKEFDIDNFYVKAIEEKMGSKSQYMAFPKYKNKNNKKDKDEPLYILTGKIKLSKGGIPRIDGEHKKSDADREFFWLGLDREQPECVKLFDALQQIDNVLGEKIKDNGEEKIIYELKDNKKVPIQALEYVPIVRETEEYTDEKTKKVYEPYKRIKVRFDTHYEENKPEGEPSKIETALYLLDNDEPEEFTSVTDFEKVLRWNCEARFVISVNKFWAMKAQKNKKRECGFSIKCHQIYITKEAPLTGQSTTEKFKKRLFISKSTDEPEDSPKKESEEESPKQVKKVQSSDEEEPVKKPVKKPVNKSESEESDSDSDDEPVKKPTKKPVKKVSSDEESEEEPVKKPVKKVVKKQSSSEESDSEDEPVKKPVKKTK